MGMSAEGICHDGRVGVGLVSDDDVVGVKENGSRDAYGIEVQEMGNENMETAMGNVEYPWLEVNDGPWVGATDGVDFCSFDLLPRDMAAYSPC